MLGGALLSIVWLSGVTRRAANRVRTASQPHMWLVRLSMAWLAFGGALAVFLGLKAFADGGLPSFAHLDTLRHSLALGAIVSLIVGMAFMILPEFAAERQGRRQNRDAAILFALLASSSVLRVAPGLLTSDVASDARNAILATAGVLAEIAIVFVAVRLARLVLAARSLERRMARPAARALG
jgi:hypothetical protein